MIRIDTVGDPFVYGDMIMDRRGHISLPSVRRDVNVSWMIRLCLGSSRMFGMPCLGDVVGTFKSLVFKVYFDFNE